MELQPRLRAEWLAQLLAGDEPRCFWTPARVFENEPFRTAEIDRALIADAAHSAFSGELHTGHVDTGGFRWVFTRLIHEELAGVFIIGARPAVYRDERLAALPLILQFNSGRLPNAVNLHRLMDLVLKADPKLFSKALLFASAHGQPFVLLHDSGESSRSMRSWSRWPLERLFTKRRAAIITNPVTNERGLAIPFHVPPLERYVVIFQLIPADYAQNDRDFLTVLECIAPVVPQAPTAWRTGVYDRIDASALPSSPRLFFYGDAELRGRIKGLVDSRGWEFAAPRTYSEVLSLLKSGLQIMLIDEAAIPGGPTVLRWLRHAAANVPILYFAESCDEETQVLVDACVSPKASNDEIFVAIKALVRELPQRRRDSVEALVSGMNRSLSAVTSYQHLATTAAEALVSNFAEWAAVHLFDSAGELYHAELPARDEPILRQVPMTFLNGYAVMKTCVDELFYAQLCEDPAACEALATLNPRSGAAIPLIHNGTLVGSIVALSITRDFDEADFEGLAMFAEAASNAFASLQSRRHRHEKFNDTWTRVSVEPYHVDVYRPRGQANVTFRVSPLERGCIRIEAENAQGGRLTAVLNADSQELVYEAVRFPPPFHVAGSGPVALTESDAPEYAAATVVLEQPSVTLIHDVALTRSIDTASIVEILRTGLREREANPAASLGDIDDGRLGFAAITFR
jgi:hypothetical protein